MGSHANPITPNNVEDVGHHYTVEKQTTKWSMSPSGRERLAKGVCFVLFVEKFT